MISVPCSLSGSSGSSPGGSGFSPGCSGLHRGIPSGSSGGYHLRGGLDGVRYWGAPPARLRHWVLNRPGPVHLFRVGCRAGSGPSWVIGLFFLPVGSFRGYHRPVNRDSPGARSLRRIQFGQPVIGFPGPPPFCDRSLPDLPFGRAGLVSWRTDHRIHVDPPATFSRELHECP